MLFTDNNKIVLNEYQLKMVLYYACKYNMVNIINTILDNIKIVTIKQHVNNNIMDYYITYAVKETKHKNFILEAIQNKLGPYIIHKLLKLAFDTYHHKSNLVIEVLTSFNCTNNFTYTDILCKHIDLLKEKDKIYFNPFHTVSNVSTTMLIFACKHGETDFALHILKTGYSNYNHDALYYATINKMTSVMDAITHIITFGEAEYIISLN